MDTAITIQYFIEAGHLTPLGWIVLVYWIVLVWLLVK